jgi:hypothetical protein
MLQAADQPLVRAALRTVTAPAVAPATDEIYIEGETAAGGTDEHSGD